MFLVYDVKDPLQGINQEEKQLTKIFAIESRKYDGVIGSVSGIKCVVGYLGSAVGREHIIEGYYARGKFRDCLQKVE